MRASMLSKVAAWARIVIASTPTMRTKAR